VVSKKVWFPIDVAVFLHTNARFRRDFMRKLDSDMRMVYATALKAVLQKEGKTTEQDLSAAATCMPFLFLLLLWPAAETPPFLELIVRWMLDISRSRIQAARMEINMLTSALHLFKRGNNPDPQSIRLVDLRECGYSRDQIWRFRGRLYVSPGQGEILTC
jgi:hypothetical protein